MQFSMQTLFWIITILAVMLAIAAAFLSWKRRHESATRTLERHGYWVGGQPDGGIFIRPGDVNVNDQTVRELVDIVNNAPQGINVTIDLAGTQVTDTGLIHLQKVNGLARLVLRNTQVTDEGVKKLRLALPNCKIEH